MELDLVYVLLAAFCTGLSGFFIGRISAGAPGEVRTENRQLRQGLQKAEMQVAEVRNSHKVIQEDLEKTQAQRDQYRKMAESHEVKYPEPKEKIYRKVWEGRSYQGLPDDNFEALTADLKKFEGHEVFLDITIQGLGDWREIISSRWHNTKRVWRELLQRYEEVKEYVNSVGPNSYQGPVDRVMKEIKTFMHADRNGFRQGKKWASTDSPLKFVVSLTLEEAPVSALPEIHTVEIAVVEERIVERVIEKPVLVEGSSALHGQTKEDLVDLIEAVLDVRESTRHEIVETREEKA